MFAKEKGGQQAMKDAGIDTGSAEDTSPDEWPPASTEEGGKGASLRMVTKTQQYSQGGQSYKGGLAKENPSHYYELENWT